ncbi:MAG: preprotein translocase subunit SecG [Verrucomicrobia bacterium]|nr:MAG: preprotein translocase subunit SecG [Verrucomicrobiota bacterium]
MSFFIGLLTVVLVLNCLLLILLVLVQLPKKEAGAGLAFGGAASDALFGAGSGNVLTKLTKHATIVFFVLTILVTFLQSRARNSGELEFRRALEQQSAAPLGQPAPQAAPAKPATAPVTNLLLSTPAATEAAAPATNTP